MRTRRSSCQQDLFAPDRRVPEMTPAQRLKILGLLQTLLIEASAECGGANQAQTSVEAGDDEDHV